MSTGQIIAVFVLFPFVVAWAFSCYGIDIVTPIARMLGVAW